MDRSRDSDVVLDQAMPVFTSREYHCVAMPQVKANVMDVVEELTWADVPGFRALITAAGLGMKRFPATDRVLGMFLEGPYEIIHRSTSEIVIVGILPLSKEMSLPDLGEAPVHAYRSFAQPGIVKVAVNFLLKDEVLSTETRNQPIGRKAAVFFAAYWMGIRLGSGLIRRSWLKGVRARALDADRG